MALIVGLGFLAALAPPTAADHVCDPYPIGRCGAYQRESVAFCHVVVQGRLVDATDHHVISLGPNVPGYVSLDGATDGLVYLRRTPGETVLADPWEAPLPKGTLYVGNNGAPGLQITTSFCGTWIWFAECEPMQWMPFGILPLPPDLLVA